MNGCGPSACTRRHTGASSSGTCSRRCCRCRTLACCVRSSCSAASSTASSDLDRERATTAPAAASIASFVQLKLPPSCASCEAGVQRGRGRRMHACLQYVCPSRWFSCVRATPLTWALRLWARAGAAHACLRRRTATHSDRLHSGTPQAQGGPASLHPPTSWLPPRSLVSVRQPSRRTGWHRPVTERRAAPCAFRHKPGMTWQARVSMTWQVRGCAKRICL